jgi:hypothetical protein
MYRGGFCLRGPCTRRCGRRRPVGDVVDYLLVEGGSFDFPAVEVGGGFGGSGGVLHGKDYIVIS